MKKIFLPLILSFMLLSCQKSQNNQDQKTSSSQQSDEKTSKTEFLSEDGPLGKFSEPIKLKGFYKIDYTVRENGDTVKNNVWTRGIKDELNIILDPEILVSYKDYNTKINAEIASGNIPDYMLTNWQTTQRIAKAGLLADLTPAYEKFASPDTRAMMEMYDGLVKKVLSYKGKIYGLGKSNPVYSSMLIPYIRGDWLKKLGLEIPKNIDELENVLDAFVHDDPDGNGIDDTNGMIFTGSMYGGEALSAQTIFSIYKSYPGIWQKDGKGGIFFGGVNENTKKALAKLQDFYKKGLIYTDFAALGRNPDPNYTSRTKAGFIPSSYYWFYLWGDTSTKQPWEPMLLQDEDGDDVKYKFYPISFGEVAVGGKKTKYPDAIVKLVNFELEKFKTDSKYIFFVQDGKLMEEKGYKMIGQFGDWKDNIDNIKLTDAVEKRNPEGLNKMEKIRYDKVINYLENGKKEFMPEYKTMLSSKIAQHLAKNGDYISDEFPPIIDTKIIDKYASGLYAKMEELFTNIVMGQYSVDDGWNKWMDYFNNNGGADLTKKMNELYKENQ